MSNVKNNIAAQETRRKLLDAAGAVFAERGLHAATVRQITDRAGVNLAAVNYHFKDKFELYAAVIRHALSLTPIAPPPVHATPEERLRQYVAHLIDDLYSPGRPPWRAPLVAHEFAQPTAALDAVMEELIRPRSDLMIGIVRDILGPGFGHKHVLRAAMSVGAQCFLYLYQSEVVRRLHPDLLRDNDTGKLARHIVDFSLAALHALRRRKRRRRCKTARPGKAQSCRRP